MMMTIIKVVVVSSVHKSVTVFVTVIIDAHLSFMEKMNLLFVCCLARLLLVI